MQYAPNFITNLTLEQIRLILVVGANLIFTLGICYAFLTLFKKQRVNSEISTKLYQMISMLDSQVDMLLKAAQSQQQSINILGKMIRGDKETEAASEIVHDGLAAHHATALSEQSRTEGRREAAEQRIQNLKGVKKVVPLKPEDEIKSQPEDRLAVGGIWPTVTEGQAQYIMTNPDLIPPSETDFERAAKKKALRERDAQKLAQKVGSEPAS